MKRYLILIVIIILSGCSSNSSELDYQGEWMKSKNALDNSKLRYDIEYSKLRLAADNMEREMARLYDLDSAYLRAIKGLNCLKII